MVDFVLIGLAALCLFVIWCNMTQKGRRWVEKAQEEELAHKRLSEEENICGQVGVGQGEKSVAFTNGHPRAKDVLQLTQDVDYISGVSPLNDAYILLNARPCASVDELRAAYREAVRKYHPDARQSNGDSEESLSWASEKMKQINAAWYDIRRERGL